jgi:hypothetical protein
MKLGTSTVLRAACISALGALALMSWSLFDPRPFPVIAAMSVGQVLGTTSFLLYLFVVARELRPLRAPEPEATEASGPPT